MTKVSKYFTHDGVTRLRARQRHTVWKSSFMVSRTSGATSGERSAGQGAKRASGLKLLYLTRSKRRGRWGVGYTHTDTHTHMLKQPVPDT